MITINPYNSEIAGNDNKCLICHDKLSNEQCYELPECKHQYHTNCIIQWFRSGNSNCPYCNSQFENDKDKNYNKKYDIDSLYPTIKSFSKKDIAPKILKKKVDNIEKMLLDLKKIKNDMKLAKSEVGKYSDVQKKIINLKNKIYKKQYSLYTKKTELLNMVHIAPIIIPQKKK